MAIDDGRFAVSEDPMDKARLRIKEFLSRFFKSHDLQPDEDIFALGFVNSLLAM